MQKEAARMLRCLSLCLLSHHTFFTGRTYFQYRVQS